MNAKETVYIERLLERIAWLRSQVEIETRNRDKAIQSILELYEANIADKKDELESLDALAKKWINENRHLFTQRKTRKHGAAFYGLRKNPGKILLIGDGVKWRHAIEAMEAALPQEKIESWIDIRKRIRKNALRLDAAAGKISNLELARFHLKFDAQDEPFLDFRAGNK